MSNAHPPTPILAPLSMYQASVPVFQQMLAALCACIEKAEAEAARKGYDTAILAATRLRPDMMPFAQQVQVATSHATGAPARLAGLELPVLGDEERTLPEVRARIARALDFLRGLRPGQIDGSEDREIVMPKRARVRHLELAGLPQLGEDQWPMSLYPIPFRGRDYLLRFAMPNFYFHVTTAYVILRSCGVELGKHDYLGDLPRLDGR